MCVCVRVCVKICMWWLENTVVLISSTFAWVMRIKRVCQAWISSTFTFWAISPIYESQFQQRKSYTPQTGKDTCVGLNFNWFKLASGIVPAMLETEAGESQFQDCRLNLSPEWASEWNPVSKFTKWKKGWDCSSVTDFWSSKKKPSSVLALQW